MARLRQGLEDGQRARRGGELVEELRRSSGVVARLRLTLGGPSAWGCGARATTRPPLTRHLTSSILSSTSHPLVQTCRCSVDSWSQRSRQWCYWTHLRSSRPNFLFYCEYCRWH